MIRETIAFLACIVVGLAAALYLIALTLSGAISAADLEDNNEDGHHWPQ